MRRTTSSKCLWPQNQLCFRCSSSVSQAVILFSCYNTQKSQVEKEKSHFFLHRHKKARLKTELSAWPWDDLLAKLERFYNFQTFHWTRNTLTVKEKLWKLWLTAIFFRRRSSHLLLGSIISTNVTASAAVVATCLMKHERHLQHLQHNLLLSPAKEYKKLKRMMIVILFWEERNECRWESLVRFPKSQGKN